MRCLARRTSERYETAAAAGEALDTAYKDLSSASGLLTLGTVRETLVSTAHRLGLEMRRRSLTVTLLVLALLALAVWQWTVRGKARHTPGDRPLAIAVMPFQYSGPDDEAYLRDLLPLLITERLRKSAGSDDGTVLGDTCPGADGGCCVRRPAIGRRDRRLRHLDAKQTRPRVDDQHATAGGARIDLEPNGPR